MSTFLDGVGQCQVIDKSSELVDLKGHDITSLAKTGTITWEHQAGSPATLVGKILKAKKIFSKDDCENDRELYFWNKVKTPYLYVMGELLDDYTASAKECAGQMKYSRDNPELSPLLGFSIEGSEIPNTRKGMVITRSIARKVTLTQAPCNSMCVAEIYENADQKSEIADDFESLFKSKEEAITLFKSDIGEKLYTNFLAKREDNAPHVLAVSSKAPKTFGEHPHDHGTHIGTTRSGKKVFSHGRIGAYGFNPAEHQEASEFHRRAVVNAENPKLADNHMERAKLHTQAAATGARQENRYSVGLAAQRKKGVTAQRTVMGKSEKDVKKVDMSTPPPEPSQASASAMQAGAMSGGTSFSDAMSNLKSGLGFGKKEKLCKKHEKEKTLKKAIEAGSYNASPSTLTNGAAYQRESMGSSQANTGAEDHKFQGTKKKDWNKRASEEYDRWPHREKFEAFMSQRMPHLAAGEIRAIGKTIALKKSVDMEKSLQSLVGLNKAEDKPNLLGSHFLMSAENPVHPKENKLKMNHEQTLAHLKQKGYKAHAVQGHYGAPETSIMVHNVNPKQAEELHGIASNLGQDSSIYSHGGKHEMRFHHGENKGKKVHGEGTAWHKEKPKDMYTTMPNGKHFTHNFNF